MEGRALPEAIENALRALFCEKNGFNMGVNGRGLGRFSFHPKSPQKGWGLSVGKLYDQGKCIKTGCRHFKPVSGWIKLFSRNGQGPLIYSVGTMPMPRGGLGEKSGPGVTVRPAHSIHGARPTQYTARCPLNTRRVAHSMHRTYRPVSGLLGKIPIHLTLFWMITKKLHHICFFLI